MKKINLIKHLLIMTVVLVNTNCRKEQPVSTNTSTTPTQTPTPPAPSSSQPAILLNAGAGTDHLVFLPTNYCRLDGWFSSNGINTFSFAWKKISGPASFLLEGPNLLSTKVSNLTSGVYSFELTVSDSITFIKDTCTVIVGAMPDNPTEIIFENKNWSSENLLWGYGIVINNVYQFLPPNRVFRTYIKRDGSTIWEELVEGDNNSPYEAAIINGNWRIWSTYQENDTPDIKFTY